jgi:Fe2+ or Zn2+ uptake regulation protein
MSALATVAEDLRRAGLRGTKQRIKLLALLRAASAPIAVEELVRKGRGEFDTATAYRILDALVDAKLAARPSLAKGRAQYEATGDHHHHAVCRSCDRVVDVEACLPSALDERVRRAAGFALIDDHALEFFGLCNLCAKRS